ncbi:MAG: U32 family peptidase [Bacteroidales bacterium]|nr:U32 family peptidase [Bacteroidales bacterium]
MRSIELLSPARNLECGIEAIRHGADAVYIGAPRFGARAAAGNSIDDLAKLVRFAHPFGVRIYVTLNTLLYDDELLAAQELVDALAAIHVDALITQDPRIRPDTGLRPGLVSSPIPLHASTQMDNRSLQDVRDRLAAGYQQTVLARELSLDDIRAIHAAVPEMPLEVFVHGALCVSYSGRCYASEYCFGRSANRGECAQFCRLPFDLIDADGHLVEDPRTGRPLRQRHLLSLRDMNRAADLEALMDAGVSSFKIEGRLKDVGYVKNITAYYRQHIDAILARRSTDYGRSSFGTSTVTFSPNPLKSFNRGFTDYFLHGRTTNMACHTTPKSLGEPVGTVKYITDKSLSVAGTATFANGDGLCFINADDQLTGFRVNRVDQQGRLYPADPSVLKLLRKRVPLYRNQDATFERVLSRPTADRRLSVRWTLQDTPTGYRLTLTSASGHSASQLFESPHEEARTPQSDHLRRQLLRLGDTPFICTEADIDLQLSANWFIPSSTLAEWRRQICDSLLKTISQSPSPSSSAPTPSTRQPFSPSTGEMPEGQRGSEMSEGQSGSLLTCRYCLRHALGVCTRDGMRLSAREPLSLRLADGRLFPLHFDCRQCEMTVERPD